MFLAHQIWELSRIQRLCHSKIEHIQLRCLIFGAPNSATKFGDLWQIPRFWHTEFVILAHQTAAFDTSSYKSFQYFSLKKKRGRGGGVAFRNIQFGVPKYPVWCFKILYFDTSDFGIPKSLNLVFQNQYISHEKKKTMGGGLRGGSVGRERVVGGLLKMGT